MPLGELTLLAHVDHHGAVHGQRGGELIGLADEHPAFGDGADVGVDGGDEVELGLVGLLDVLVLGRLVDRCRVEVEGQRLILFLLGSGDVGVAVAAGGEHEQQGEQGRDQRPQA